jgi:hypothetical protein
MRIITLHARIDPSRVSLHSLRIGGLLALFAACVPSHLKQSAGRWSSGKSFISYARATMEQYGQIASALNNPELVTINHMRQLYSRPSI